MRRHRRFPYLVINTCFEIHLKLIPISYPFSCLLVDSLYPAAFCHFFVFYSTRMCFPLAGNNAGSYSAIFSGVITQQGVTLSRLALGRRRVDRSSCQTGSGATFSDVTGPISVTSALMSNIEKCDQPALLSGVIDTDDSSRWSHTIR